MPELGLTHFFQGRPAWQSQPDRCAAEEKKTPPVLGIVVPCYNEDLAIEISADRLMSVLNDLKSQGMIHPSSFIYFVDDGSKDRTWQIATRLHAVNNAIKGLKLSRNVGHQNAVFAGLMGVRDKVDCAITIDADLQDDITVIKKMIDRASEGCEVVYGVRNRRSSDTFFKRNTALLFYKMMKWMGVDIIHNHADFRLASRRVIEELSNFREVNVFLRGIFPLLGFKTAEVYYDRNERCAGETKYPLKKMFLFALEGITSFSVTPMRLVTLGGLLVSSLSFLVGFWAFTSFFTGKVVPGWASTVVPVYLLGGIQLLSIGIIGEYIGKIYKEVKGRPRYIKEKEVF